MPLNLLPVWPCCLLFIGSLWHIWKFGQSETMKHNSGASTYDFLKSIRLSQKTLLYYIIYWYSIFNNYNPCNITCINGAPSVKIHPPPHASNHFWNHLLNYIFIINSRNQSHIVTNFKHSRLSLYLYRIYSFWYVECLFQIQFMSGWKINIRFPRRCLGFICQSSSAGEKQQISFSHLEDDYSSDSCLERTI